MGSEFNHCCGSTIPFWGLDLHPANAATEAGSSKLRDRNKLPQSMSGQSGGDPSRSFAFCPFCSELRGMPGPLRRRLGSIVESASFCYDPSCDRMRLSRVPHPTNMPSAPLQELFITVSVQTNIPHVQQREDSGHLAHLYFYDETRRLPELGRISTQRTYR